MDVSENGGTPKSSILIGFSIINHPFWGTPIFGNTQIVPVVWIPGIPLWKGLLLRGTPKKIPKHRVPIHQFTISWLKFQPAASGIWLRIYRKYGKDNQNVNIAITLPLPEIQLPNWNGNSVITWVIIPVTHYKAISMPFIGVIAPFMFKEFLCSSWNFGEMNGSQLSSEKNPGYLGYILRGSGYLVTGYMYIGL